MSTLNALAQKHGITVPLRVSDCPKILTIVKIDNQQVPDGQGGKIAADILTAKAENGQGELCSPTYTVRLNQVTVSQLVRIFGTDAEIEGKRVLASTFECKRSDGDKVYITFAHPPAVNTPKKPEFLPGPGEGTAPVKDKTQFALNPEAQAAHRQPRTHHEGDVVHCQTAKQAGVRCPAPDTVRQEDTMKTGQHLHRRILLRQSRPRRIRRHLAVRGTHPRNHGR